MGKHTQEPWALLDNRNVEGVIVGGQGKTMHTGNSSPSQIATATQQEWMAPGERLENARRIVACVNACRGLPTDELEQKGLVAAVGTELLEADQLRSELVAALALSLEQMVGDTVCIESEFCTPRSLDEIEKDGDLPNAILVARAAIAKAKGGAA